MASVLCVQQKMSRMRSVAKRRAVWKGFVRPLHYKAGYSEIVRARRNDLALTSLEAR